MPSRRPASGRDSAGERPAQRQARQAGPVEPAERVPPDLIELGVLRGAYGVKGWVRVVPHEAEAPVLRGARKWWVRKGDAIHALEVTAVRRHGGGLVAKWAGCDTPEAAEAWRTGIVAVARGDFPAASEGEFYWVDLVGATVVNRGGVELGKVAGLRNNGAQDMLEVAAPDGADSAALLIPLVDGYVESIDIKAGLIRVDWEPDW